ncbi:hypothetical protein ILUMI_22048 [Ignelater luminosus]|uniref:Uncharacterized protein n=1 Tax=Ignelater luminosus TaxID=2038154 RepID=A0A8K0G399_IGNLU|nr:hypothetical protein ILUMI_22048 [Ignelater luminosus]
MLPKLWLRKLSWDDRTGKITLRGLPQHDLNKPTAPFAIYEYAGSARVNDEPIIQNLVAATNEAENTTPLADLDPADTEPTAAAAVFTTADKLVQILIPLSTDEKLAQAALISQGSKLVQSAANLPQLQRLLVPIRVTTQDLKETPVTCQRSKTQEVLTGYHHQLATAYLIVAVVHFNTMDSR